MVEAHVFSATASLNDEQFGFSGQFRTLVVVEGVFQVVHSNRFPVGAINDSIASMRENAKCQTGVRGPDG